MGQAWGYDDLELDITFWERGTFNIQGLGVWKGNQSFSLNFKMYFLNTQKQ